VNFLVDTNVISELQRGRRASPAVVEWFESQPHERVFTSVIVLGEIRRGIERIARRDRAQADHFERWYTSMRRRLDTRVLPIDEPVMMMWSRISVSDPLPAYDGLLAATALVHDMTVVTRNTPDFRQVGAKVLDPWSGRPTV
jgi:predicted nucleic acid-binding protein